jgi:hypothetical protein
MHCTGSEARLGASWLLVLKQQARGWGEVLRGRGCESAGSEEAAVLSGLQAPDGPQTQSVGVSAWALRIPLRGRLGGSCRRGSGGPGPAGTADPCTLQQAAVPAYRSWCCTSRVSSQAGGILPSQAERRVGGGKVGYKRASICDARAGRRPVSLCVTMFFKGRRDAGPRELCSQEDSVARLPGARQLCGFTSSGVRHQCQTRFTRLAGAWSC